MKFHHFFTIIEFFIVFISLILPSIKFYPPETSFEISFSVSTVIIYSILSLILFYLSQIKYNEDKIKIPVFQLTEKKLTKHAVFITFTGFIQLIILSFFFNLINSGLNEVTIVKPENSTFSYLLLEILQFLVLSFYEEVLFRKYLVDKMIFLLPDKIEKKKWIISVIISALIFSLCHVYEGWMAVIFSFISALIFSYVYKKTENILCPWIIHYLYNVFVFLIIN